MQALPFFALIPLLAMIPVVVCVIGAGLNLRKNPALGGMLAVLAAGFAALAIVVFRTLVLAG